MAFDFLDLAAEVSFLDAADARGFATDAFLAGPLAAGLGLAAALPLAGFLEAALSAPFPLAPLEAAPFFSLF